MEVTEYIDFVASEGEGFARAAERGPLDVAISPCPGWDMRELVRHLGLIHLWAAGNMAFPKQDWLDVDDLTDMAQMWPDLASSWPEDAELVAWYRKTLDNLLYVLRTSPPDLECFSFLPAPTPLTMWSRRQASEIAIHRFDAEQTRNQETHYEAEFAADMLDELLIGFASRPRKVDIEVTCSMHVWATDLDQHWFITIGPEGIETSRIETSRQGGDVDLVIKGSAAELYLLMWNRTSGSTVDLSGDEGALDIWHATHRVRWV